MSRVLVLVILAGCDAGAKPTPPPPPVAAPHVVAIDAAPVPDHSLLASIARGACYGTCAVYTLAVYRDGRVEYDGEDFVKTKGKATGTVTAEQLAALDKLFTDDHYLAYKSEYKNYDVTDNPSAVTSYHPAGATTTKTVDHYYGDMHAPESLTNLEHQFDEIVKTERWIGTRAERDKLRE
jgi:hypothetical protein